MDAYENDIANWLKGNGIDGDAAAAKALYAALDVPGDYGALAVERKGENTLVVGPAGELTVEGALGLQTLRMRLEEIINHPGQPVI